MGWEGSRPSAYPDDWAAIRQRWAAKHQPWHVCTRCGRELGPMGPKLHLDHDDRDRTVVRGFAHGLCNVRAAARKARRIQLGLAGRPVRSREW